MGREQDLIYAAQNGNLQKLEGVLATKEKRFKGSFFGKGLKINWQDQSGYTALHFASLNGYNDAVVLLLQNDASTYMPDNAGNYPLHLASFNGHAEVARTLINKGPSRANVNEQNGSGDSALHIAAQYGHRAVVQVLLECHADASTRNEKGESPLDLAAQYGKLASVQLIVLSHPYLLHETKPSHSPLHLASRNGHTNVVGALVECGMSVNVMCDLGTPLHEAALYGKISVVKLLLRKGVDVRLRNNKGETVLDVLIDNPSQRSQQITALIYEHSAVVDPANSEEMRPKSRSHSGGHDDGLLKADNAASKSATVPRKSLSSLSYDMVPPPRPHLQGTSTTCHQGKPTTIAKDDARPSTSPVSIVESSPHYALVTLPQSKRQSDNFEQATISPLPANQADLPTSYENNFDFSKSSKLSAQLKSQQQYDIVPSLKQKQTRSASTTSSDSVYQNPPSRMSVPAFPSSYDAVTTRDNRSISLSAVDQVHSPPPPEADAAAFQFYDILQSPETKGSLGKITEETGNNEKVEAREARSESYDNVQISNRPTEVPAASAKADTIGTTQPMKYQEIKPAKVKQKRRSKVSMDGQPPGAVESNASSSDMVLSRTNSGTMSEKPFNEAYEWNKIDSLLTSMNEFTLELEGSDNHNLFDADSVGSWLTTINLPQYEPSFIANGFDDIRFLGGDVLDECDLLEIGIQNLDHISTIVKAARKLPRTPQIGDRSFPIPSSVADWLLALELSDYESSFSRRGYDTMDRVRALWELELSTVIDVGLIGHRKRMIYSLGNRPEMSNAKKTSWSEKFAAANQPSSNLHDDPWNDDSIDVAKQLLETAESLANGFAQRRNSDKKKVIAPVAPCRKESMEPPATRQSPPRQQEVVITVKCTATKKHAEQQTPETDIDKPTVAPADSQPAPVSEQITEPQRSAPVESQPQSQSDNNHHTDISDPFLTDIPIRAHWKHRPEVLLYEAAIYSTQYLGSHPVTKVTGTSSTLEACNKMKHIAQSLQKIPIILLSINVRGIEFIDAQSKHLISSYNIKNISYCAQDPEDLRVFAYITKDNKTQRNYCHVFKAASLPLADEIVLTIGQSFELAYEKHVRLVAIRSKANRGGSSSSVKSAGAVDRQSPTANSKGPPAIPKPYNSESNTSKTLP